MATEEVNELSYIIISLQTLNFLMLLETVYLMVDSGITSHDENTLKKGSYTNIHHFSSIIQN